MSSQENQRNNARGEENGYRRPRHFKDDDVSYEPAAPEEPAEPDEESAPEAEGLEGEPDIIAPVPRRRSHHENKEASPNDANGEPELVTPVDSAEGDKPEKRESDSEPETAFDYVAPTQSFMDRMRHPERGGSPHSGKTKIASREEIAAAEEGFIYHLPSSKKKKGKKHHHHHHHHSSSGSSSHSSHSSSGSGSGGSSHSSHSHSSHSSSGSSGSSSHSSHSSHSGSSSGSGSSHHHHHHHHHHRRRMPLWLKIIAVSLCVIIGLAGVLAGTYLILREIGRNKLHNYDDIAIVTPTEADTGEELITVVEDGKTIVYDGVTYRLNEDVVSINFIGVDHDIQNNAVQSMSDAVNIVALDTETGKMTVIGVSRDSMLDVNLYSDEGRYIDTEKMQLAYAYSFGNNSVTGGANTSSALSKLFYGLPLDNYFAINMDALTTINDAIGGVTVTSSISFVSPIDGRFIDVGDQVTLRGREVQFYVRNRDIDELDSNNARMQRQQEYIRAFFSQVIPAAKKDLSMVTNLYDIIKVNSDTDLDLTEITYLASVAASKLGSSDDIEFLGIKGKMVEGEYAEFYTDDKDVLEKMLKVFYKPVE